MQQEIYLQRYTFRWKVISKLTFPLYSGSILRGLFGNQLRKTVCFTKQEKCFDCPLIERCSYGRMYESLKIFDGSSHRIHPYIIEPFNYGIKELDIDDEFEFSMVLIGKETISDLSLIIFIWEQILQKGFKHRDNIGYADLINVKIGDKTDKIIYDNTSSDTKYVLEHRVKYNLSIQQEVINKKIKINLVTPLRIQGFISGNTKQVIVGKQLFDSRCFIQALLRRCKFVFKILLNVDIDVPQWEKFANITIGKQHLYWTNTTRFSRSQSQEMSFYGLTGWFELDGDFLEELYPWLLLGQYLHIGKSSTFGFGRYKISLETK